MTLGYLCNPLQNWIGPIQVVSPHLVNGESAYLADSVVQRLISLSLATRTDDGKIHASELRKDIVLRLRPIS